MHQPLLQQIKGDNMKLNKNKPEPNKPEPIYPFPEQIYNITRKMHQGNFGLWYNKYTPIHPDTHKACNASGNVNRARSFYNNEYQSFARQPIKQLLENKHIDQFDFCQQMQKTEAKILTLTATLKTRLITGIGQTHPAETSLVLDHNLGIPYIPATTLKGLTRLGHILFMLENNNLPENVIQQDRDKKPYLDLSANSFDNQHKLFGSEDKKAKAIFLDAYPLTIPELEVDILTPHYKNYYTNPGHNPPTDTENPVPVQFLTVKPGIQFVFRTIILPEAKNYFPEIKKAYIQILQEEGIGAKTALGYGLFKDIKEKEPEVITIWLEEKRKLAEEQKIASLSPEQKIIYEIKNKLTNDPNQISNMVNLCLDNPDFSSEVFKVLKARLQELGQWTPKIKNKQRRQKLQKRNQKIDARIKGGE